MTFTELKLNPTLIKALPDSVVTPSPIQQQVIPEVFNHTDILAFAQTGSGKTYAFALPLLTMIAAETKANNKIHAVIIVPTRELARQINLNLQPLAKSLHIKMASLFGGVDLEQQLQQLAENPTLIIATPGRLLALIKENKLDLSVMRHLVLDEADRLIDMGFWKDLQSIISFMPKSRQTLCFSATLAHELEQKMHSIMQNTQKIQSNNQNSVVDHIDEKLYLVNKGSKTKALLALLKQHANQQVLVFISAKDNADALTKKLIKAGVKASALHGNKDQSTREQTLTYFKQQNIQVLIATDLLARGIHIDALPMVINYDLPESAPVYIHRVGRTARAGHTGFAISLVCHAEILALEAIRKLTKRTLPLDNLTDFPVTDKPSSGAAKRPVRDKQANRRSAQKRSIKEFKPKYR
ncbi:DEAD/DEAH box helicase [Vibrio algivorus]|uniref:DEAD/DEAH box helicase n=1 Tax=Vibrio algivorus TaxID=1667024 RepID=A0A557PEK7_9VIBR|nr:DEAD/DEAH box helicase [Vibrio algivorus]TVO39105.1 DEAD/DEAH box helicase [Vibrio algivorus]